MVNLPLLQNQMKNAKSYVYTIGQILMKLAEQSGQIATLIEQDLAVPELSLEACGKELLEYARKHQENGYWACAVFGLDAENPALKVILDFYKIPSAWVFETHSTDPAEPMPMQAADPKDTVIDLMDLL